MLKLICYLVSEKQISQSNLFNFLYLNITDYIKLLQLHILPTANCWIFLHVLCQEFFYSNCSDSFLAQFDQMALDSSPNEESTNNRFYFFSLVDCPYFYLNCSGMSKSL